GGGSLRIELNGVTSDRLPSVLDPHTPDHRILATCLNLGGVLVTKDASLRIKGAQLGVAVQDYRADTAPTHQVRQGVVEHQVDSDTIDRLFEEGKITLEGVESDRKSTRLNSSHVKISYAVFCLKKKKKSNNN